MTQTTRDTKRKKYLYLTWSFGPGELKTLSLVKLQYKSKEITREEKYKKKIV